MADIQNPPASSTPPTSTTSAGPNSSGSNSKPRPELRIPGLNWRLRIPSRNWMIFWTVVGSWTGMWAYDRRQKKRVIRKWCDIVSPLSQQPLPPNEMPRKLTIFLTAPPADSLITSREHFHEYIKPILIAGGVDWDAVEGRREGDVRAILAERIRSYRKRHGEPSTTPIEDKENQGELEQFRARLGVQENLDVRGDIVIGRNTWKEYVRGLHEGWLGPLDPPPQDYKKSSPTDPLDAERVRAMEDNATLGELDASDISRTSLSESDGKLPLAESNSGDASPTAVEDGKPDGSTDEKTESPKPENDGKEKKRKQPSPFISTASYESSSLPPTLPDELTPSTAVTLPHILGFRNTPIRMYRFLNRRKLADDIGRQVAAAVLASTQSFSQEPRTAPADLSTTNSPTSETEVSTQSAAWKPAWEQADILEEEEGGWHKSVKKREDDPKGKERIWLDPIVLDSRIASRMKKFALTSDKGD